MKGVKVKDPTSFDDGKEVRIEMLKRISVLLMAVLLMLSLAGNAAMAQTPPNRDECDGVEDPLICDKGQPGADEAKEKGKPDDPNAWGSVASQLGDAGVMGAHSSDPVPFVEGHETPRNGLGNEARNDALAHGTPEGADTGDHMADHACRAAAGGVPGFPDVDPNCALEPGNSPEDVI